ncbi:hypothetical protein L2E82_03673 [Cichorium intybus]|uniref:Uncharacterized protein n=1 Tax=Cichorium intybus TaxID=13427 RepID=A0ACB9H5C7_CICIN|nr:hypothetical protein L2E82_03673 [Cichorium intybus]
MITTNLLHKWILIFKIIRDVIWFRREELAPIDSIEGFYSRGCSWPSEYRLKVINDIFEEVDKHIEEGDLVREFKMSALPILYDHVVKLIKYLLIDKQRDRDQVVILFQDMHKVVTRYNGGSVSIINPFFLF